MEVDFPGMAAAFGQSAGSLALDLVNTIDWRDDPSRRVDLIPTAAALAAWARHVGYPAAAATCRLPGRHHRAVALRDTLAALFAAVTKGRPLPAAVLAQLTQWNQDAWRRRILANARQTTVWRWDARTTGADRLLFTIALDAAELLLLAERSRLRVCEGEGCGWFFVDRSKAGRRRWCNMEVCGNRVKVRSYRERVAHD
jgi:predicted RNA-binding Zn ribbon-like protein